MDYMASYTDIQVSVHKFCLANSFETLYSNSTPPTTLQLQTYFKIRRRLTIIL